MSNFRRLILGMSCIFIGLGLLMVTHLNAADNQTNVVNVPVQKPANQLAVAEIKPTAVSGEPVHLNIPSIGIDLPVINGYYNAAKKTWTLYGNKVQFAAATSQPNNASGITFMYGHNNRKVFNKLPKIQPGDTATVVTSNGHTFTYQFVSSKTVDPTDSSILSYQGDPILTLQTCTGFWYQNRSLFTFKFVSVS